MPDDAGAGPSFCCATVAGTEANDPASAAIQAALLCHAAPGFPMEFGRISDISLTGADNSARVNGSVYRNRRFGPTANSVPERRVTAA
jgi:hypothetical protein